jgi:hypothetical protein
MEDKGPAYLNAESARKFALDIFGCINALLEVEEREPER